MPPDQRSLKNMMQDGIPEPDLWTLDAHCDTWYMQQFLRGPGLPPKLQGVDRGPGDDAARDGL